MVFAAVAGHLQALEFAEGFKKWHACLPGDLYTAPVHKFVPEVNVIHLIRPCPTEALQHMAVQAAP